MTNYRKTEEKKPTSFFSFFILLWNKKFLKSKTLTQLNGYNKNKCSYLQGGIDDGRKKKEPSKK